ncbi:MAG: hypothetical protein AAFX50_01930 [Acidobacteriota bacterium]
MTQSLRGRDVGRAHGVIVLESDELSYRFSRLVEVDRRSAFVTATYRIEGHPTYKQLTVESPSRGSHIFVAVDLIDGGRHYEAFSFD